MNAFLLILFPHPLSSTPSDAILSEVHNAKIRINSLSAKEKRQKMQKGKKD